MRLDERDQLEISLPIRDQIADILRRQIISGELKSGNKISERDISAHFNVSTAPVKEAIRTLNMEGLLRSYPRRGTFVANVVGDNVLQLVHLRSVIEGTAAYWGTKNISDDDISRMAHYLSRFDYLIHNEDIRDKAILDKIARINYHFHLVLSNAAGNDYLDQLVKNLGSINNTIRYMYYSPSFGGENVLAEYEKSLKEHTEIFEAVKARDSESAERLTVKHINSVANTVVDQQNK